MLLSSNINSKKNIFKSSIISIGNTVLGGSNPIRLQSMTNTDTLNTNATVEQAIKIYKAGGDFVRITVPGMEEARNLEIIKKEIRKQGYNFPLIADVHFNPEIAEYCARIVEKVRINPGNYTDKRRVGKIEYSNSEYLEELERISTRISPLLNICKEYGTALRIGSNHGSLSDRIMFRYGDTPIGMAESAMEFLRICDSQGFRNIVVSMKASNIRIMIQATRILVEKMMIENLCFPVHLGVTEAGESEDGRIKSAIGIGSLLADGIGDTIRVSLTEAPEKEIPVAKAILKQYLSSKKNTTKFLFSQQIFNPFVYCKRQTNPVENIGGNNHPVVIGDFSHLSFINTKLNDDFIYIGKQKTDFNKYKNFHFITDYSVWEKFQNYGNVFPVFSKEKYLSAKIKSLKINFVEVSCIENDIDFFKRICSDKSVVLLLKNATFNKQRIFFTNLKKHNCLTPVIICQEYDNKSEKNILIAGSCGIGSLLTDGFGDGVFIKHKINCKKINSIAFGILQATQTRISKTEFISCPTCGRTQFDITGVLFEIKKRTSHLKGLKIAVMGCVVNGPGEMADADYGYVGAGKGNVNLYKGKNLVKKNINVSNAVEELISLIKENNAWIEAKY